MTPQLNTALDLLIAMDNPEDGPFAQEVVISSLLTDHNMEMSEAHNVLCTAEYLYTHGLTAVKA